MNRHKKLWYAHSKRALQATGHFRPGDASTIGNRSDLHRRVQEATRDGKVSINVDQMDCDCSRWTSGHVMPSVPFRAVEQHLEEIYNNAEGPIYWIGILQPEHVAEYTSRDLALEAFEDGHPSSVSTARYDEEGDYDPTPWCHCCGAMEQSGCNCGELAATR